MAKIKLTKGELKKQRDALKQYKRYLPTLQLKKQQLQMEILHQSVLQEQKEHEYSVKHKSILSWAGLLSEAPKELKHWIMSYKRVCTWRNIAGVDLPALDRLEFLPLEYDLFLVPAWVDAAVTFLQEAVALSEEIKVIDEGIGLLRRELRITTQRVNLFEKVKIPEAEEAIRLIKIYIGDQMANAVGRSKIAKRKIEEMVWQEAVI